MKRGTGGAMSRAVLPRLALLLAAADLCACAAAPPAVAPTAPISGQSAQPAAAPAAVTVAPARRLPHYRCDHGIDFTVAYGDDSAVVDAGSRGRELLQRDAGGVSPVQTVFSNTQLRAEFGLGPSGNEAMLHYAAPALQTHCVR